MELHKDRLGPPKEVIHSNTRLPQDFKLSISDQKAQPQPTIPLTREEIARHKALQQNKHYLSTTTAEPTPIINGYKPVKTPVYFKVPDTPIREEFGI